MTASTATATIRLCLCLGPCWTLLFIYLLICLAVLGLYCCVWAFPSSNKWGPLCFALCGLLIAVTSHCGVALWCVGSSRNKDRAQSPALAGISLPTVPLARSLNTYSPVYSWESEAQHQIT